MAGRPPRAPKPPPITSAFGNSAGGASGPSVDNAPAPA
jgi:cell division protease FtsH